MGIILRHQLIENGQDGYVKPPETNGSANRKCDQDFVDRVASIPLVKDSVSTAQAIARKTSIGRFALSTANSTFNTVTRYTSANQPKYLQTYYQTYLEPQIKKADAFGCRTLDTLQSKVPIINRPSSEIIYTLTQPSYQIINDVKVKIDVTFQSVTHPAHVIANNANKKFSTVVDTLGEVVDKYLPPITSNDQSNTAEPNGNAKQTNTKKVSSNDNQVKRAYGLLNETTRRLTVKVTDQIYQSSVGIHRSFQNLFQLAVAQRLQENIKFIQDALAQSVKVYSEAAEKHLPNSVAVRVRQANELIMAKTKSIQEQIAALFNYTKSSIVPDWLKNTLTTVVGKVNQQLESIKSEFSRTDISYAQKVKGVTGKLQNQVLPLLHNMGSQIKTYLDALKERAQKDMNIPLHDLGFNRYIKIG